MAPLKGITLGQRQKYYNQLVKEAIAKKTEDLSKINFEEDDVDNMIKIDIACEERNVDYILDVFKCEDMLYVSRAINKSTWLITDPVYAHIINPKFLHSELFPKMNTKAVTKLMLHIRRYLKDGFRVKAFYNYVNEKNPKDSLHWLGNCSLKFIEKIVARRANEIPVKLLNRLCKKSISILRVVVKSECYHNLNALFSQTKYFLKSHKTAEEFLNMVDSVYELQYMQFNAKYTNMLMKQCPKRILSNFHTFYKNIHLSTFVNCIKTDEIKSFLIKNSNCTSWKSFETLTPFLNKLPREEVLDFLSILYGVDFSNSAKSGPPHDKEKSDIETLFYEIEGRHNNLSINIYRWYQFAPFHLAFRDLKKFIYAESSAEERHSMLIVLLTCASYDFEHVKTVLQYYHDKHINEPYLHKITFVNNLLTQHDAFRFDDSTWNTLNELFHSLEVYIESGNKVQACLISIIVHNVLRDLPVHEIVEEKFEIKTLKGLKKKLNPQEQDKLFNYLYKLSVTTLHKQSTDSETGMREAIKLLKTIWKLLNDWNNVETHRRFVIDKIAEFGDINKKSFSIHEMKKNRRKRRKKRPNRDWKMRFKKPIPEPYVNISSMYNMVKSYRIELFENSLVLHASEEVLLNALKHDPKLLARHKSEIDALRCDDEISLRRFLRKLRIYWPDSLAAEWTDISIKCIQHFTGHRALVRGIITLLPRDTLLDFIKMYSPIEKKIHWSNSNEIELSMQKHIAKHMHIARPQLPAEAVLWYAKGDYLQYALLSLNTVYYNLRSCDVREYINIMLNAPVSLQKHGIRLAFIKFRTDEIITILPNIWNKTKNSSIRAILFTSMFGLLCKEKKDMTKKAIWAILSSFIDDLNHEENKVIYRTLGKVNKVPLSVIGDFYQKAYLFLKALPPKADINETLDRVIGHAKNIIEYLDSEFVEQSLLGSVHDSIARPNRTYLKILSAYLLCSEDSKIQMQKYKNLLQPVIEQCVPKWADGRNDLLEGLQGFLVYVSRYIPHYVFVKKMTMPVQILANIRNALVEDSLRIKEHYILIRRWQVTVAYIEMLHDMMKKSKEPYIWEDIRSKSTQYLAKICADCLAADANQFFTSIYVFFKEALQFIFENFKVVEVDLLNVLYKMLDWNCPSVYFLVLNMIPSYGWGSPALFSNMKEAIKRKIYFYPSEEVRMHYFLKFSERYSNDNDSSIDNDSQGSSDSEQSESQNEQSSWQCQIT